MFEGHVEVEIRGIPATFRYTVPMRRVAIRRLLPVLRGFVDLAIDCASRSAEREGKPPTCSPGCAACCRQMATVSPSEAHALRALVASMSKARRAHVQRRFAEARSEFSCTASELGFSFRASGKADASNPKGGWAHIGQERNGSFL